MGSVWISASSLEFWMSLQVFKTFFIMNNLYSKRWCENVTIPMPLFKENVPANKPRVQCVHVACRIGTYTVSDPILTWPRLHVILYITSVPSVFFRTTRKSRFGKAHGPERANYIVPRVHPTMQLYQGLWNPARFLVLCCCRGCCIMCFFPHNKKMFHENLSCPPPDKQEDI